MGIRVDILGRKGFLWFLDERVDFFRVMVWEKGRYIIKGNNYI